MLEMDSELADAICKATSCGFSDYEISAVSGIPERTLANWERRGEKETTPTVFRYYFLLRTVARTAFQLKVTKQVSKRMRLE
jgi:hypothetical protein